MYFRLAVSYNMCYSNARCYTPCILLTRKLTNMSSSSFSSKFAKVGVAAVLGLGLAIGGSVTAQAATLSPASASALGTKFNLGAGAVGSKVVVPAKPVTAVPVTPVAPVATGNIVVPGNTVIQRSNQRFALASWSAPVGNFTTTYTWTVKNSRGAVYASGVTTATSVKFSHSSVEEGLTLTVTGKTSTGKTVSYGSSNVFNG